MERGRRRRGQRQRLSRAAERARRRVRQRHLHGARRTAAVAPQVEDDAFDFLLRQFANEARDIDRGERELIRKLGMRFFTMREVDERGMSACMDDAIAIASQASGGYAVTFDVDALDPTDAPGSGTLVRGGLTYREAHLALEKIAEAGGMCSLEIVEINTALDINNKTAELGVELILSALGKTIL